MLIANEKRKTNIVEYILYLWQLEDLIRACNFDINIIDKEIVSQYKQPEQISKQMRSWYDGLIQMMALEGVKQSGHIQVVNNVVLDISDLHILLLKSPNESQYRALYKAALPHINHLRTKAGEIYFGDVQVCLTALYGLMLLRIQKKEILTETLDATQAFSQLLSLLAKKYHDREKAEKENN